MSRLLEDIAEHFGVGSEDIRKFIFAAPARYKVFSIAKRHGGRRTIAQPSAALKMIQRFVIDTQLGGFPVHEASAAYVTGRSIADNAAAHRNGRHILKLDFENFFNSLIVRDWRRLVDLSPDHGFDRADLMHLERILFWGDGSFLPTRLSVGAPSSPTLSNMIMYRFDAAFSEQARNLGAVYTRYADDITVSASDRADCLKLERVAAATLKAQRYSSLRFKADKRGLYGPGQRRMVTGLIVTPSKQVSIGRDRKRLISTLVHHASLGRLDVVKMLELKGLLGFVKGSEPRFLTTLEAKYGAEVISNIMKFERTREL